MRRVLSAAVVIGCVLVFIALSDSRRSANEAKIDRDLANARNACRAGRFDEAVDLVEHILAAAPNNQKAMFVAAEAETKRGNFQKAITFYDQITDPEKAVQAATFAAEIERHVGNFIDAVRRFQTVLLDDPENLLAHRRLAWIFNVHGCRHAAQPHLFKLCQLQAISLDELVLLSDRERLVELGEEVNSIVDQSPQAIGVRLGMARREYKKGRPATARQLQQDLMPQAPDWMIAEFQVLTGRVHLDADEQKSLSQWRNVTLSEELSHPDLWLLHGEISAAMGNHQDAVDCFRAAIALAPNSQRAHYQLASVLVVSGRGEEATPFRLRANRLRELSEALTGVSTGSTNLKAMLAASRLCDQLGRPWEAIAWQLYARQLVSSSQPPQWAMAGLTRRLPVPTQSTPQTLESACLCSEDLLRDTAPLFKRLYATQDLAQPEAIQTVAVTFNDNAKQVGLDFQYHTGLAGRISGRPMYSFPGGGLAVIDFDLDAWPDLYIPQGTTWPPSTNKKLLDGLFRNIRGGQCLDVARWAGIQEARFSHGVSVGDFDNDGFPDIYVANIYQNSLFRNLGDGTFEEFDVPEFPDHGWTTSCVIADLNNDGLPDLYDVNYVRGDGIYEKVCEHDGVRGTCTPMAFEPESDRFFQNNGDGTFNDQTSQLGFDVKGGNGLGVIAADFNGNKQPELFVANDADPNFLFARNSEASDWTFEQISQTAGVAVDGGGSPQACMGTAIADADGDHRIDLFVTNYFREHNVLYLQLIDGAFVDSSRQNGLFRPGYLMLGFGTQFIDADLDTWPDLFVANGHVDDFRHTGAEYAMKPQYFANTGQGIFSESTSASLGSYFETPHLGRGVASLDWNADGRPDVAVSHLDHPIALLINQTQTDNHFLKLSTRRTTGDRDGVGTSVFVTTEERTIMSQFVAGSGYMASNEKTVLTGVGDRSDVHSVSVTWRGHESLEYTLASDCHWILVEGRQIPYEIPY